MLQAGRIAVGETAVHRSQEAHVVHQASQNDGRRKVFAASRLESAGRRNLHGAHCARERG
eukprot:scaffold13303_cov70-Phaeocystis_antarctica.AAC.4